MTLQQLQTLIDTNRIDSENPIDLTSFCNTGLFSIKPELRQFGIQITDEGADLFKAQLNLEVQHASELVIATIEKNGGTIITSYYDSHSLWAVTNPTKWFEKGVPLPRRMLPPQDAIDYYTNPKNRGYLADPEEISKERLVSYAFILESWFFFLNIRLSELIEYLFINIFFMNYQVLAQKYGYKLPKIEDDPKYEMLTERKDPRQIFYGLNPGWVISLKDKAIIREKTESTGLP